MKESVRKELTNRFSIENLLLANEICFLSNFKELLERHLPEEEKEFMGIYVREFTHVKYDLLKFVFEYCRIPDNMSMIAVCNKIILSLIQEVQVL